MERLRKPFRGLHWKLTLSYTLVTVAALVAVLIIAVVGGWVIISNTSLYPSAMTYVVERYIVPPVASYLDGPEPDVLGLASWLQAAASSRGLSFQLPNNPSLRVILGDLDRDATMVVLDENLEYLAGIPEPDQEDFNTLFDGAGEVLEAALNGDGNLESISQISPNKILTIAVPVTSDTGAPLGVVVLRMAHLPQGSLTQTFLLIVGSIIVFTPAAGIIGTIFGYFTARALTRRLHNITQAADAWSQGDFSAHIRDRSNDELGKLAHRLNRMAERLQNLLYTRRELATLEERNRLARDLHDSVKQQIFATAMQVGAARALLDPDSRAALEHLNEAEQLARQAQTELTALIRELRPASLQGKGLTQALKELVAGWSRQNKIAAEISMQGERALPLEVEQAMFRVAQEALSNVARHSEATHIEAHLAWENNEVSITISDNGKGFDIDAVEGKGVGLRSMRERMEALGGSLSLERSPGRGMRLVARCQITNEVSQ